MTTTPHTLSNSVLTGGAIARGDTPSALSGADGLPTAGQSGPAGFSSHLSKPGKLTAHAGGWRVRCALCPAARKIGGVSKSLAKDELVAIGWWIASGYWHCEAHKVNAAAARAGFATGASK